MGTPKCPFVDRTFTEKRTLEAFDQNKFALTNDGIVGGRKGNPDAYGNLNLVGTPSL